MPPGRCKVKASRRPLYSVTSQPKAERRAKRALVVHPSDELYGADRVLVEACKVLRATGYKVAVCLPTDLDYRGEHSVERRLSTLECEIVRWDVPVLRRSYLRSAREFLMLLGRWRNVRRLYAHTRPDLIYLNTSAVLLVRNIALGAHRKTLLHVHEAWQPSERATLGLLASRVDTVVCVSEASLLSLPKHLQRKAFVVHNGFDLQHRGSIQRAESSPLRLVIASRWNRRKGHEFLLEALEAVHRPISLEILGGPPLSGPSVEVPKLVAMSRHSSSIEIVGAVIDVMPHLSAADVVLVPSVAADSLPTVAIEAMAAGRAVVGTRVGGLPELIVDGVTGILVDPTEPARLSAVLRDLDHDTVAEMGRRGRQRYEELFSQEAFQERLSHVLNMFD